MRIFLIIFSLFVFNHAFACDHSIEFPSLTGPHSVGHKNIEFTDEGRDDPYNHGHHRKIKVTVYYPSIDAPKLEPYGDEEVVFWKKELQEPLQDHAMTQEDLESIVRELRCTQVFKSKDGISATGPFPVILFEHGFGVTAGSYQRMLLELVSKRMAKYLLFRSKKRCHIQLRSTRTRDVPNDCSRYQTMGRDYRGFSKEPVKCDGLYERSWSCQIKFI